jgi:hypothetical protein
MKTVDVSIPGSSIVPSSRFTGETHAFASGDWHTSGTILFQATNYNPLSVLNADGSRAHATRLDPAAKQAIHTAPQFLKDGRRFLFEVRTTRDAEAATFAGSLDTPRTQRVLEGVARLTHGDRYVVIRRGETLLGQRFDASALKVAGEPCILADRVGAFAASQTGVVAYQTAMTEPRQLTRLDREGREVGAVSSLQGLNDITLSPDGKVAAVVAGSDVWLVDTIRNTPSRFTFHPEKRYGGLVWSPDGARLFYSTDSNGFFNIMERISDGSGSERVLLSTGTGRAATSWSHDGRFLIYHEYDAKGGWDLWALPAQSAPKPFPLLRTDFSERQGQLSPDGKWLAYTSDESGMRQVYVSAFMISESGVPSLKGKWPISKDGGHSPRWNPMGKELFFIGENGVLQAVDLKSQERFEAGLPRPLFELSKWVTSANWVYRYDVSPDGKSFWVAGRADSVDPSPITLVINWTTELPAQ